VLGCAIVLADIRLAQGRLREAMRTYEQALTLAIGEIVLGPPGEVARGLLMGAAWAINLALAEWIIRRPPAPPARRASPARSDGYDRRRESGRPVPSVVGTWSRSTGASPSRESCVTGTSILSWRPR
jgi:hypothetical protein